MKFKFRPFDRAIYTGVVNDENWLGPGTWIAVATRVNPYRPEGLDCVDMSAEFQRYVDAAMTRADAPIHVAGTPKEGMDFAVELRGVQIPGTSRWIQKQFWAAVARPGYFLHVPQDPLLPVLVTCARKAIALVMPIRDGVIFEENIK